MDQISIGSPKLWAELERRSWGERAEAEIAIRDLARYYHLLARELVTLRLSRQEAMLIWRALLPVWKAQAEGQVGQFTSLVAAVEAEWRRSMGCQDVRKVDCQGLLARLQALSPGQSLALLDAVERFQARVSRHGWIPIPELLQAVGLSQDDAKD